MKIKLLLIALMLFALNGFAQVTAYPAPDLTVCNNDIVDLTLNSPVVLGNQDPQNFTVTFYTSLQNAQDGIFPIANPESFAFNMGNPFTIYVTVTENSTGEFDVTSFTILSGWAYAYQFPEWQSCIPVKLPPVDFGAFYTGPGATGTLLPVGTVISESQTVYLYVENGPCTDEAVWNIVIEDFPVQYNEPTPLLGCDEDGDGVFEVNLFEKLTEVVGQQEVWAEFYETEEDAEANMNMIPNPENYVSPATGPYTVYLRIENLQGCSIILPIEVLAGGCTGNTLTGTVLFDEDNNGCGSNDVPAQGIAVYYINNNDIVTTFTNEAGEYTFTNVPNGTSMVYVQWSTGYTATPEYHSVTFPGTTDEMSFCLNVPAPQLNVGAYLVPLSAAQPGFEAHYALVYYNDGTIPANGTLSLEFDAAAMTYLSSSVAMTQTGNTLNLNYSDLQPYAVEVVYLTFTMSLPPVIDLGDTITFTTQITPLDGDVQLYNNTHIMDQAISNSFDPNDIAVREGEFITPDQTDEYLHYTIRFQNIGNADAVNIRLENELHANLNASTLEPIASSHAYRTELVGNSLTFFFDDIYLAGSQVDEPNSHGFITYRIKPVASVGLGDSMTNQASIFFDFNEPIVTNQVITTVQEIMGVEDITSNGFVLYPNPASEIVTLQFDNMAENTIDVAVTNVLGKTVAFKTLSVSNSAAIMDVSSLETGVYFVALTSGGKTITEKLVIK